MMALQWDKVIGIGGELERSRGGGEEWGLLREREWGRVELSIERRGGGGDAKSRLKVTRECSLQE